MFLKIVTCSLFFVFGLKKLKEIMENENSSMEVPVPSMINGKKSSHSQVCIKLFVYGLCRKRMNRYALGYIGSTVDIK